MAYAVFDHRRGSWSVRWNSGSRQESVSVTRRPPKGWRPGHPKPAMPQIVRQVRAAKILEERAIKSRQEKVSIPLAVQSILNAHNVFIPSWPDDLRQTSISLVVGDGQSVEKRHMTFTHDRPMEWFLPGIQPTHKMLNIDIIIVTQFHDGKLASERIYWDQDEVLRQIGFLKD